jgi:uncharacterized membrane protein YtjA (UPF0391 family)
MLSWIILFLIIGLIASALGMGGVAGFSFSAAKLIFVVFLILLIIALVFGRSVF